MKTSLQVPEHIPADRVFEIDIHNDPDLKSDMHRKMAAFQDRFPGLFFTPCSGGYWVITRQKLLEKVVNDFEHFSSRELFIPKSPEPLSFIPLSLDPPEHIPYRAALMRFFGPKYIREMEPHIREQAVTFIEAFAHEGETDFLSSLGALLPVSVFLKMAGLPLERFDEFRDYALNFLSPQSETQRIELYGKIQDELTQIILERQKSPREDIVSRLAHEDVGDRKLTLPELQSMCMLIFIAGMDTVANGATFAFYYLANRPDIQEKLAADISLATDFVEESLRLYGVATSPRVVTKDTELDGVQLREGEMVLCMFHLAGTDDQFVPDATSEFRLDRTSHPHMAFGGGPHICVGQHLARMELRILVEEWFKRIPRYSLDPRSTPEFRSYQVMALSHLPLKWDVPT